MMVGMRGSGSQLLQLQKAPVLRTGVAELPLAVYVHIPFCVRKCYYCDFNSGPASDAIRDQYVDALIEEIHRTPWRGQPARTVFFGGGTPSELNGSQLGRITAALTESFELLSGSEATIECNPGTITLASLREMRALGFNRISLGVQSFHDHHLQAIGRIHNAAEAREAVRVAREAGFRRLNVDLIFCLPEQTLAEWQQDVEWALELRPEHLSLYNLTIEENTEFGRRHRLNVLSLPDEDLSADMYEWTLDRMQDAGFVQYEVSNFALPGEECRHNQVYWRQEPSLGFGISAASYYDGVRWTNTGSMQRYLATAGSETGPDRGSEERLEPLTACGESIMLALRTCDGVDLEVMAARYGLDAQRTYGDVVQSLLEDRLLQQEGRRLTLTRRGIMLANAVCGQFLPD
jgi:oxygen-independent coproporphyrinogen-3 oxidase